MATPADITVDWVQLFPHHSPRAKFFGHTAAGKELITQAKERFSGVILTGRSAMFELGGFRTSALMVQDQYGRDVWNWLEESGATIARGDRLGAA